MHNILIVDDQSDILRILEREFRRHGDYLVATANNPSDALDVMDKSPVELVISDVRLGNQTGFSLLQQVNQRHPGVGTMLMTAYRSPAYRQQADALGVSFFLEKPFPVATLITAVERFFQQRVAQVEAQKTTESGEMNTMAHFKAQDLVQLFCLNGRNVRITLNVGPDQPPGYIYIQRGRVVHAEYADQKGEAAFQLLLQKPDAALSLQDWDSAVETTIQAAWEHLLLEAARQQDSSGEEEEFIPDMGDLIPLPAHPVPIALADPFADFWQVAQIPTPTPVTPAK
jgi:YesN/AraC family two-component response regulator